MNVNRLCGSGAQAIVTAAQMLMLGDAAVALAGGAECMSRSPYALPSARWGQKMGDTKVLDMMTGALTCPFGTGHMGVTGENVAAADAISRADQDAFALESQARAARAIAEGRFVTRSRRSRCRAARARSSSTPTNIPNRRRPRAGQAEARLPEGRNGDGGQCQRASTTGRRRWCWHGVMRWTGAHRGPASWAMRWRASIRR
jgi:hypothetical protein